MTIRKTINQSLPLEILIEILIQLPDNRDIQNYRLSCRLWYLISYLIAKPKIHVRLDSSSRADAFTKYLAQDSSIGPQVDTISVTSNQCNLADLQYILSSCMNLKKLHFGHDVDMSKYFKLFFSNQTKLPDFEEIKMPNLTNNCEQMFGFSLYYRFYKSLVRLELSLDSNIRQLLRKNYGGLPRFISKLKQLKSLQLNYPQEIECIDLELLVSQYISTLTKIVVDGVGELTIKSLTSDSPPQEHDLTEIRVKSKPMDGQNLISAIHALKGSRDKRVLDKVVIYSTFSDKLGDKLELITREFLAYYLPSDHLIDIDITRCNPELLMYQHSTYANKWTITSTENSPYMLSLAN
ncbi:hypothetical protein [Parasitella parasitica]|uniref:F-box domain-containing protein n=1 Tax=Parasitella parasitica TaxID=35722 RepID=A0A0B7N676_9FUNG|nr:hypothetical protein [Parasitella parasitica]